MRLIIPRDASYPQVRFSKPHHSLVSWVKRSAMTSWRSTQASISFTKGTSTDFFCQAGSIFFYQVHSTVYRPNTQSLNFYPSAKAKISWQNTSSDDILTKPTCKSFKTHKHRIYGRFLDKNAGWSSKSLTQAKKSSYHGVSERSWNYETSVPLIPETTTLKSWNPSTSRS